MPTSRIYIDRAALAHRSGDPGLRPPVVVDELGGETRTAHEVLLRDAAGAVVARLVYNPKRLQPSGTAVWVETDLDVELVIWPDHLAV